MSGGGDFSVILGLVAFLVALWLAGKLCKAISLSPVIGEIFIGVALGPEGANILAADVVGVLKIMGVFGVTLMIMESGLHVNFVMLRKVGLKASIVAVFGTFLPILGGVFTFWAMGFPMFPEGLAAGVSLAPTSVGMALKMLSEAKQLGAEFGQAIVTAAFVDDIMSLVCLAMLLEVASGDISVWAIMQPLVSCILFCIIGALLAYYFWPRVMPLILDKVPSMENPEVQDTACLRQSYADLWAGMDEAEKSKILALGESPVSDRTSTGIITPSTNGHQYQEPMSPTRMNPMQSDVAIIVDAEVSTMASKIKIFQRWVGEVIQQNQTRHPEVSNALTSMQQAHVILFSGAWPASSQPARRQMLAARQDSKGPGGEKISPCESQRKWLQEQEGEKISPRELGDPKLNPDLDRAATLKRTWWIGPDLDKAKPNMNREVKDAAQEVAKAIRAVAPDTHRGGSIQAISDQLITDLRKKYTDAQMEDREAAQVIFHVEALLFEQWMALVAEESLHGPDASGAFAALSKLRNAHVLLFDSKRLEPRDHQADIDSYLYGYPETKSMVSGTTPHRAQLSKAPRGKLQQAPGGDKQAEEGGEDGHGQPAADHKWNTRDEVLLVCVFTVLIGYGALSNLFGSHLLGAFIGGMSFCKVHHTMAVWQRQVKRIAAWLVRMFFGSTVAFSIPISQMMTFTSWWRGMIMGVGPCVAAKVVSGFFTGIDKFVIGFAMVGRGEFAFLVAETALMTPYGGGYRRLAAGGGGSGDCSCDEQGDTHASAGSTMLSKEGYAVVVWALLMAAVVAPAMFRVVLKRRAKAEEASKNAPGRATSTKERVVQAQPV